MVDQRSSGDWGHILIDHIVFSDVPAAPWSTETSVNVLIGGQVVGSASGNNSSTLQWATIDLSGHVGETARIQIVDQAFGDWIRLDGRRIGSYLGLTPSESSSGASRALGGITKTGNGHARRLLIEAAWHHRPTYRPSFPIMRARWDRASAEARARGHAGNQRLHNRSQSFQARRSPANWPGGAGPWP